MNDLIIIVGVLSAVILGYLMGFSRGNQEAPHSSPIPFKPSLPRVLTHRAKPGVVQASPEELEELKKTPDERKVDDIMIDSLSPYLGDPRKAKK